MGFKEANAIDIGYDILSSSVDEKTGSIILSTGDAIAEESNAGGVQLWFYTGFISRPAKPEQGKQAPQVLAIRNSDNDIGIATRDIRCQKTIPNIEYGEAGLYATNAAGDTGRGYFVLRNDGSVELMSSAAGSFEFTVDATGALTLSTTYGSLTFGPSGVVLEDATGARLTLSAITQLFAPQVEIGPAVTAASTALWGPTGVAGAASATVKISP